MESKISLSQINLSSNESWGPDPNFVFEQYKNLPFAPFNKLEKIGKFCDISNPGTKLNAQSSAITNVPMDDEEGEFTIVETKIAQKPKYKLPYARRKPQIGPGQLRPTYPTYQPRGGAKPFNKNARHYPHRVQVMRTKFKDNAGVQADWEYIIDANKTNFDKTPVTNVKVTDIAIAGKIGEYDKSWDGKINPKKNVPFSLPPTISFGAGPRSDRFIQELVEKDRATSDTIIYATDTILSTIMTVKNSVFPWDITVVKEGNQLFLEPSLEKNKANYIDILTVNENTANDLPEDEKEMLKLCIESTNVNKKFIEISTKGTEVKEFGDGKYPSIEVPDRKVYRYRKWTLDNRLHVVVRSEIDAYAKEGDNITFVKVCALNECQPQLSWKENYELKEGALISTELRNNLCKICRWLCQAFLAEANLFKLGFVTKPNPKETKHQVLTVEDTTTANISSIINFRLKDNWSIVKTLAEIVMKEPDGVYAFVKLPYKQSIRIYAVPEKEEQIEP
jgi:translation initiation factor 3 subunit D